VYRSSSPSALDVGVDVLVELRLVALLIVVGESLHVLSNVATEDVLAQGVGVQLLCLIVVAGESLLVVGDVETAIGGTLQRTEDSGTGRSTMETNVKIGLEGAALLAIFPLSGLGDSILAGRLFNTLKLLVQIQFLERTASEEKTSSIGGSPVGQTVVDAISLELVGVGCDKDLVTSDLGGDQLGNDVAVGEADDEAVLGRVVLVLGLGDQSLTSIVIGLVWLSVSLSDQVRALRTLPACLRLYLVW